MWTDAARYQVCRRRTGELVADRRRLAFLRALERAGLPLAEGELLFARELLGRAGARRYHFIFSSAERARADALRRVYGGQISPLFLC
jgi:hypothetical protein